MRNDELEKKAASMRLDTLLSICNAGKGCSGSCMSVVEILVSLYYGELLGRSVLKFDAGIPGWDGQDYVILSKAHAVPIQYSILADLGFFEKRELDFLGKPGALLRERPHGKIPGVAASLHSYGQGLSVALGLALGLKLDRRNNKVYCILGDGELQSGVVWEAAMAASHYQLNNLIAFVDNNKFQSEGLVNSVMDIGSVQAKFEAFGWEVIQVRSGHDFDEILAAVARAWTSNRKPVCIWCHTIAGRGIDFAERKANYQSVPLSKGEMGEVINKFKEIYDFKIGEKI